MVKNRPPDEKAFFRMLAQDMTGSGPDYGTLIVLKGHLVLEQVIRAKLEATLQDPMQFRRANLRFYQMLCLARAVFGDLGHLSARKKANDDFKRLWDIEEDWNELRNRIAHRIEPTDTVVILSRIMGDPNWSHDLEHEETQYRLSVVISWLCGALSRLKPQERKRASGRKANRRYDARSTPNQRCTYWSEA